MYGPSECGSPAVQWRSREKIFHHNSLAALSGCSNISGDIYKPGMIVMCQLCEILIPQPAGLQYNTTACCDQHTPTTILQADRAGLVSVVVGCCCCCRFCLFISISSNWKFSISIELLIAGEEGADSRLTWPRTPVDSHNTHLVRHHEGGRPVHQWEARAGHHGAGGGLHLPPRPLHLSLSTK